MSSASFRLRCPHRRRTPRVSASCFGSAFALGIVAGAAGLSPGSARGFGDATRVDVRALDYAGGQPAPRPSAPRRLAWELRKRTSVSTRLESSRVRLDEPALFDSPFLYWAGDGAFPPLSEDEVRGLRRFVRYGGALVVDDASPGDGGFLASARRALARAFPETPIGRVARDHVLYRSFYLVPRPVGRVEGPDHLDGIELDGRLAVVLSAHDLGGAWARDNLGGWRHPVDPGGERQREMAIRLGVNLLMYALCLDYKDDQVHVPFILRRRGGRGGLP